MIKEKCDIIIFENILRNKEARVLVLTDLSCPNYNYSYKAVDENNDVY